MTASHPEPLLTCVHEAAHCVAALALGWTVLEVSAEPGGGFVGHVDIDPDVSHSNHDKAVYAVAGLVEESRWVGLGDALQASGTDQRDLDELGYAVFDPPLWSTTTRLLRAHRVTLLAVAGTLQRAGTLSARDLEVARRRVLDGPLRAA